ncbi:MAG: hypothetical protein IJZ39_07235 [Oscillospiraceae bacterium]|nr:hypothetical protein [Oscillospiraceae bacterium]
MDRNDSLKHYGVKGMRWGVRRTQAQLDRAAGRTSEEQKAHNRDIAKKVAVATGAALTVAAAAGLYVANKDAVDSFVTDFIAKNRDVIVSKVSRGKEKMAESAARRNEARTKKDLEYVKVHKDSILRSPSKLNRYKDYLDENEVKTAIERLRTTRDLHQLSQESISRGAKYVNAFLAYGTAATTAYNFKNSSIAKDMKNSKKRKG